MRVLVIDDDVVFLGMMRTVMEEEGHSVATARDGDEGLAAIGGATPDVIILDLAMPLADGESFAHAYARRPGPHAPIIVISGDIRSSPMVEGAVARLPKPFELSQLTGLLRDLPAPA